MAIPSEKSKEITDFLETTFGRTTAITQDRCVSCMKVAVEFRDVLSEKEYQLSGLCQECQDQTFGK